MNEKQIYLIDADVFISAKNQYYAFDICPGFWKSMIHHCKAGNVRSLDRVKSELLAGRETEDLVLWVKNDLPSDYFLNADSEEVTSAYAEVMLWVQKNPQYSDAAKAEFAAGADGWLVAYAMVHGTIIVTNEQPRPESRRHIMLPDICTQFKVSYKGTFSMLNDLAVRFEWSGVA